MMLVPFCYLKPTYCLGYSSRVNKFSNIFLFIFSGPLLGTIFLCLLQPRIIKKIIEGNFHSFNGKPLIMFFALTMIGILISPIWYRFKGERNLIKGTAIIAAIPLSVMTTFLIIRKSLTYDPCADHNCDSIGEIVYWPSYLIALLLGVCAAISAYLYKKIVSQTK
ncbi:MAG: hypothetical protein DI586_07320 [Micavibrio aeruginosavorus]|uniref:Uncharacterized protein n=1 Tax=Micavibrio aeruginosavorus TaxID=349221 RepID=A0A2W5FHC4_9BACT|nr:MAG: hypothetical protein DI586_07320 [Micavibrio aeruginosavorus]